MKQITMAAFEKAYPGCKYRFETIFQKDFTTADIYNWQQTWIHEYSSVDIPLDMRLIDAIKLCKTLHIHPYFYHVRIFGDPALSNIVFFYTSDLVLYKLAS